MPLSQYFFFHPFRYTGKNLPMKKHDIIPNIRIEKLIYWGSGLATLPDGMKVIVSGGAIPESMADLRIIRMKKSFIEAQIVRVVEPSPYERPIPDHWQVYGGCKWLRIPYEKQLAIKDEQIHEAFRHLSYSTDDVEWRKIVPSPQTEGYRNKLEFSWWKYISDREGVYDTFRFGFHVQGQFDRIENCRYCVLADEEVNAIFRDIEIFSRYSWLPTYDPHTCEGFFRHLVVRKTLFSEIMLLWSVNTHYFWWSEENKAKIITFNRSLQKKFPHIVSVFLLENTGKADIVTGKTECILWKQSLTEILLGKKFEIQPLSFFQTNSRGAERLYSIVAEFCPEQGNILLDLYAGTGTIGILLAERFQKVYSVETVMSATEDGEKNASINAIHHMTFVNAKVEDFLSTFLERWEHADVLIVDPPRDGLHPRACVDLIRFQAEYIIYVSCNPATLVRDLKYLLENDTYTLTHIAPVDMFPHTHHIETVVCLKRKSWQMINII